MTGIDWEAVDEAYDRWRDEQVAAGDDDDYLQFVADEAEDQMRADGDLMRKARLENPDE